tara:strand:+ start:3215 stop:3913 length:699 start_codon:yes stop_codon:yes gene_type:complete
MQIEDSKILITGGGTGIGLALARQLVARGARVAICGRRPEVLERTAAELGVLAIPCDVADEDQVTRMYARLDEAFGGIDALINNAAFGYRASLLDTDRASFESVLATNVTGAMLVGREAAKRMVARSSGSIVNVGSTAARRGYPGGGAYAASKFALSGLTECWRAELRTAGVRVMQINPSEVITPFGGREDQTERPDRLRAVDVAQLVIACLEMDDRGFVTEATLWATNPVS